MAKAVRLYNSAGSEQYYPITITNEVYTEDKERLSDIIVGLRGEVNNIDNRCLEIEIEFSTIKSDNDTIYNRLNEFEDRVTDNEININTINADLATIKNDIIQLKNSVNQFRGIIDDLDQRINKLETA